MHLTERRTHEHQNGVSGHRHGMPDWVHGSSRIPNPIWPTRPPTYIVLPHATGLWRDHCVIDLFLHSQNLERAQPPNEKAASGGFSVFAN